MAPASYQGRTRQEKPRPNTVSQSAASNLSTTTATVKHIVDRKGTDVFSIGPDDTLSDAVKILRDKRIGALVVTGPDGSLAGILSERDIVRKLAETPGQTLPQRVSENMTEKVVTCAMSDPIVSVLKKMTEGRFRHMPVVVDGKLSGMLTIGDVVNYRLHELEHEALQLKQMVVG
ncbi:MAG: CBS domain-containing protein [Pseudomonadota bacterium]